MFEKEQNFHIAIIPDGNRRWATRKGMKPWLGHEEGAKRTEEISRKALEMGVKHLTFWGSSKDNLTKRPLIEKRALLDIYERYFKKLIEDEEIYKNQTRINIFGDWQSQFPSQLKNILKNGIEKTKNHQRSFLHFLLAYDGGDDMLMAVKKIAGKAKEKTAEIFEITKDLIANNLMTAELPEVDLVIRTGVENDPHNSAGFLMWQTQNSQYYFSDKMFPDFGVSEFEKAFEDFKNRQRRLGK